MSCIARHQLAYPIWYITLMLVADFNKLTPHETLVVKSWMQTAAILSVFFWLGGLNGVAGQDQAIEADHVCDSADCSEASFWLTFYVLVLAAILAVVSLVIALAFVQDPSVIKAITR